MIKKYSSYVDIGQPGDEGQAEMPDNLAWSWYAMIKAQNDYFHVTKIQTLFNTNVRIYIQSFFPGVFSHYLHKYHKYYIITFDCYILLLRL